MTRCRIWWFVEVAGKEMGAFPTKAKAEAAKKNWKKYSGPGVPVFIKKGPKLCER